MRCCSTISPRPASSTWFPGASIRWARSACPADAHLDVWAAPPPNAAMLAFGNLGVSAERCRCRAGSSTSRMPQNPQVLAKQYRESPTDDNARIIAHRFADEIIFRLGGGITGIAETKLYFVSSRTGHKEIWAMDYDGAAQHAVTRLGSIHWRRASRPITPASHLPRFPRADPTSPCGRWSWEGW